MSLLVLAKLLICSGCLISPIHGATGKGATLQPYRLRCEYQAAPMGIDTAQPRLSWWLESSERNQFQSAYEIGVASSRAQLSHGHFDLWDSGKVISNQSVDVEYAGRPLLAEHKYWWQVRAWNGKGNRSSWSTPGELTMGLLKPSDWKGQWIGATDHLTNLKSSSVAGYHALEANREDDQKWVQCDLGSSHAIDDIVLYPPKPEGHESAEGFGFPIRFRIEASNSQTFSDPILIADHTASDYPNPGDHPRHFPGRSIKARYIRITATKLWNRHSGPQPYCFALSELEVLQHGVNVALHAKVTAKDSVEFSGWSLSKLTDGEKLSLSEGGASSEPGNAAVMMRKTFLVTRKVKRATAFLCGLGYSELMINGRKVGNHILDPGFTDYRKRALYVSYDVTSFICRNENAVGILLGGGWFNAPVPDLFSFESAGWTMSPRARGHLTIEYVDGTSQTVATDPTWRWATGEIRFNGIRGGETINNNFKKDGWSLPGFRALGWKPVVKLTGPKGKLVSQQSPPIRATHSFRPVSVKEIKPGVYVFDLGANIAGFARMQTRGPKGTKVTLQYNEALRADGSVDMSHTASHTYGRFQTDEFILCGKGTETFEPRFTYHGFRYVQVTGLAEKPTRDTLTGEWVTTDPDPAGDFVCSNERVNLLQGLFVRTLLNNMQSIPTDCPQREKMGWMDDGCVGMELAFLNRDTPNFYTKWIHDMEDAQDPNGHVPDIVPTSTWGRSDADGAPGAMADPWWGGAIVFAPWKLYQYYDDTRILSEGYRSMKGYVDYLSSTAKGDFVEWGLGDWLDESAGGGGRRVPVAQTSTAAYFYGADVLSRTAEILGKPQDAMKYRQLANRIRLAFNAKFYNKETGRYAPESQTAQAIPLFLNLPAEADRDRVASEFIANIQKERDGHISAGIVGTLYVFEALAAIGCDDVAWKMLTQEAFPGWLFMAKKGATSLWEDWGGDNSLNHPALGCVGFWLYQGPGGIRPDASAPGFRKFRIKPSLPSGLDWVRCSYSSVYGEIQCCWNRFNGHLDLDVVVPGNTQATIDIPSDGKGPITESGKVFRARSQNGFGRLVVGSGHYHFESTVNGL